MRRNYLRGADYPLLEELWDNEDDAVFDSPPTTSEGTWLRMGIDAQTEYGIYSCACEYNRTNDETWSTLCPEHQLVLELGL